jgi:nitrogen fixation-related uncharacterized protein
VLAARTSGAMEAVIAASIFVPVIVTIVLTWIVLRGKRDDPDERLWRLQDEARRRARDREKRPE